MMKEIKKRKLTSKRILLIALSSLLVLLIAGYITVKLTVKDNGTGGGASEPPEIMEGEAVYLNTTIAYPQVSEAAIQYILVQNALGTFDLTRPDSKSSFWLGYDNGGGVREMVLYAPPIIGAEGDFNYEDLYAVEGNDGYGRIYMLTYLCTALGTPYFSERIELPKSSREREGLLSEYGFKKEKTETVSFTYLEKDKDGKTVEKSHTVTIGGRAVSGSGYYFMVDGRDYIYYTASNYYDYALKGFHSFVKGVLVAEGIVSDSAFEPYLTTDFKQWVNEKHEEENERVLADSNVIASGESYVPLNMGADYLPPEGAREDGYGPVKYEQLNFDLSLLREHPDFDRISAILTGMSVGKQTDKKLITLIAEEGASESKLLSFDKSDALKYKYTVIAIESVIGTSEEYELDGTPVGDNRYVKVIYTYSIHDSEKYVPATNLLRHAVIDLEDALIPEDTRNALKGAAVGELDAPITFEIEYTRENSRVYTESFYVDDILEIYDEKANELDKVTDKCYVTLKCYSLVNGETDGEFTWYLDLSNLATVDRGEQIKQAILGKKKAENLDIKIYEEIKYFEALSDFTAYRIDSIDYFITSELVTSFRFVNASERDPYYGESFYENTMDNEYGFYGLNASACEKVVEFLGGIGVDGTVTSSGFSGETVAVGLSHKNLDKYGLYAHKIYFELPRGIKDISEGTEFDDADLMSDFGWYGTLGFTLYISDKNYDPDTNMPFRYVGSNMYNLVARVWGEELDFVEYSFVDFWARRNLMLTDIKYVDEIKLDFNMKDVYGSYHFDIQHQDWYVGVQSDKMYADDEYFEGATKTEKLYVYISPDGTGERMDTVFEELLKDSPQKKVSITNIYNVVNNGGKPMHASIVDTVGVANLKSAFEVLQLTQYHAPVYTLTEEERAAADERLLGEPDMTFKVKMSINSYYYTYEFYRFSDRCVRVKLYQSSISGAAVTPAVSDFYISTLAYKKLVSVYTSLLDGVYVETDFGYAEEK